MKKEIQIQIRLNKELDYGDQKIFQDYVNTKNMITLNDVLKKSLRKIFPSLNSIEDKVEELIRIFNGSKIKELLILDLKKGLIRNLIRKINKNEINSRDTWRLSYKNTVLVGKTTNEVDQSNLLGNNAIAFFGDVIFKPNENPTNMKVYFDLSRLELLKTSNSIREEGINISDFQLVERKTEDRITSIYKNNQFVNRLSENHTSNIVDFFDRDKNSRIELKKYNIFMRSFMYFMKDMKQNSADVIVLEEKVFKSNEEVSFIVRVDQEGSAMIAKSKKANLYNDKFGVNLNCKIIGKTEFNYLNLIENKMNESQEKLEKIIYHSDNLKKVILKTQNEYEKEIKANNLLRIDYFKELKLLDEKAIKANNVEFKIDDELEYLRASSEQVKKNIKTTKKELKNLSKKPTKKIKKEESHNLEKIKIRFNDKINKSEEELKLLNIKIKQNEVELENNYLLIRKVAKKIRTQNEKISLLSKTEKKISNEILGRKKELDKINDNQALCEKYISKCLKEIDFVSKSELLFFSIKVQIIQNAETNKDDVIFKKRSSEFLYGSQEDVSWILSSFDSGLFTVIKRNSATLQNAESGFYKNPYLLSGLNKPSKVRVKSSDIVNSGLELNDLQEKAVEKALMTDDIAYIQGPPGTGKTQTISAIAATVIKDNGKVLISSSTHAAIDNFFERISKDEQDNPNIFLLRYIYGKSKNKEGYDFSEEEIYDRFLNCIDKFVNKDNKNESLNELKKRVNNFVEFKAEDRYKYPSEALKDLLIKEFENSLSKADFKNSWFDIATRSFSKTIEMDYFIEDINSSCSTAINKSPSTKEWNNILNEVLNIYPNLKINQIISKEALCSFLEKEANVEGDDFNKAYNSFSKWDKNKSIGESNFKKNILKNELINAIGITTKARNSFSFINKETQLFIEYPIDYVIIDEVSKSITPEIISSALLAKKVILAGDYRQLPPSLDITEELIEQFFKSKHANKFKEEYPELNGKNPKELTSFLERMYSNSLFKNQINEIKKGNPENKAYQFLKTQYRFTEDIMKVVNISYDNNEKLEMPEDHQQDWSDFIISINGKPFGDSFNVIDTSYLSEDFIDEIKEKAIDKKISKKLKTGDSSFDQVKSIFSRQTFPSRVNEYNSFIIGQLVNKIIKTKTIENKDIGIICMTRTQTFVVKNMLEKKKIYGIKVDTVDNFQGSEKDVIILDLVAAKNKFTKEGVLTEPKSRNVNFYERTERLNVAISRAKSKIFVVGAFENFLSKKVISEMEINGVSTPKKFMKEIEEAAKQQGGYICM